MENDLIDTFISIPAWKMFGLVVDQEPAVTGSDSAVRVKVQDRPDRVDLAKWYTLEPQDFGAE